MSGTIVIGAQWGDEGKGKAVDVFSSQADYVVRYQGGANAGHTLTVDGKKTVLHLMPSGILHASVRCVIASGVVLDLRQICTEIAALKENGNPVSDTQLSISDSCTVLLSYHKLLDQAREKQASLDKIGTTGKGIGPAYEDRASRRALLFSHIFDSKEFIHQKVSRALEEKNHLFEFYGVEKVTADSVVDEILTLRDTLKPYRCKDTSGLISQVLAEKKKVLFEGAQGTLLDLLHGTYPFVTSSSTLAGSACVGVGIGPNKIDHIVGISKAYTTRVGSGPFPSEMSEGVGKWLLEKGNEYGSTTGRQRRCGWLDLVALKYAVEVNGLTELALMKLDVLSGLEEVKACTSYDATVDGEVINVDRYPPSTDVLATVKPICKTFKGWAEDISQCQSLDQLPSAARQYVDFISSHIGIPISVVSVGPNRKQTIWANSIF